MAFLKRSRRKKSTSLLGRRKRRRTYLVFSLFIVLFFLFASGIVFLLRYDKLNIRSIHIEGGPHINHSEVKNVVEEELSGMYFWVFPKRNILIYPHDDIKRSLRHMFKRVEYAEVSRNFISGINVTLYEYRPYGVWCTQIPAEINTFDIPGVASSTPQNGNEDDSSCYYITKKGFAYLEAPSFSGDVYLTFFGGAGSFREYVFPHFMFSDLREFIERIEEEGFDPSSISVLHDGTIVISLTKGGRLVLDHGQSFIQAFSNLVSVLHDAEVEFVPLSEKQNNLLYIDLRFEDRVFYKMKE